MNHSRFLAAALVMMCLAGGAVLHARSPQAQPQPPRPRPGLTAQQTRQAIELAQGAMRELRKKTEGATEPEADPREYIVNVELLDTKDNPPRPEGESSTGKPAAKAVAPRAVVTSYRYFDDITVYSTIDLQTGRVVDIQAAQHMRTPLSDDEYEEAQAMARAKSDEVKKLYEQYGDQLSVYPQFSQFTVKGDPRVHRVVHLNYRVGKRDLSYPRPQVDLTTREVVTPAPEVEPKVRRRRDPAGNRP
ncbi:MAG TPA: hypothetical protein VFF52_02015 [Isosphaeraceae bacterium]|nr:hypothetical protein [Isosphaeraceae bacterium]